MVWLNRWRDPLRILGLLGFLASTVTIILVFAGIVELPILVAAVVLVGGLIGLELTV